jgi:hypothetical protein
MRRLIATAVLASAAALPACITTTSPLVVGTGTVHTAYAECSSWFLRSDRGQEYEVRALPDEFQNPGLRVRFILKERNDLPSICMVGPIVEVVSIVRI